MNATNKPFHIEKRWVYEAYQAIRSNGKAAGVDGQTLEQFEADLSRNLYKIWNRLCQEPRKGVLNLRWREVLCDRLTEADRKPPDAAERVTGRW